MKQTLFLSSTYEDLAPYRRAIWTLLEHFDVTIMGMEAFGARKEAPLLTCIAEVEQAQVYVGVIAFRLGSMDLDSGKSFTQLEYERAYEAGKDILIYLMDGVNSRVAPNHVDVGGTAEKLAAFKAVLKDRHTVEFFVSEDDLSQKLKRDLTRRLTQLDTVADGQDQFASTAELLEQLALAPKSVAGNQLRLRLRKHGKPFAASKALCAAFNLEYGNTVGIDVEIVTPGGYADVGLSQIYASGNHVSEFVPLLRVEILDVYAAAMFSPTVIPEMRARFKSERYFQVDSASILTTQPAYSGMREVHYKAEGTIALLFTAVGDAANA